MIGLFGEEIPDVPKKAKLDRAHADRPGTGPAGKCCKDCEHYCRIQHANVYLKCGLMKHHWTNGAATDIRAKDAACKHFEAANGG